MAIGWVLVAIISINLNIPFLLKMAGIGIFFNILLAVFNLLPIPPLDGARVVSALLPGPLAYKYSQLEQYGFLILLGLMYIGGFKLFVLPIVNQIQLFFIAFI
jgi:Zn-dependent protease